MLLKNQQTGKKHPWHNNKSPKGQKLHNWRWLTEKQATPMQWLTNQQKQKSNDKKMRTCKEMCNHLSKNSKQRKTMQHTMKQSPDRKTMNKKQHGLSNAQLIVKNQLMGGKCAITNQNSGMEWQMRMQEWQTQNLEKLCNHWNRSIKWCRWPQSIDWPWQCVRRGHGCKTSLNTHLQLHEKTHWHTEQRTHQLKWTVMKSDTLRGSCDLMRMATWQCLTTHFSGSKNKIETPLSVGVVQWARSRTPKLMSEVTIIHAIHVSLQKRIKFCKNCDEFEAWSPLQRHGMSNFFKQTVLEKIVMNSNWWLEMFLGNPKHRETRADGCTCMCMETVIESKEEMFDEGRRTEPNFNCLELLEPCGGVKPIWTLLASPAFWMSSLSPVLSPSSNTCCKNDTTLFCRQMQDQTSSMLGWKMMTLPNWMGQHELQFCVFVASKPSPLFPTLENWKHFFWNQKFWRNHGEPCQNLWNNTSLWMPHGRRWIWMPNEHPTTHECVDILSILIFNNVDCGCRWACSAHKWHCTTPSLDNKDSTEQKSKLAWDETVQWKDDQKLEKGQQEHTHWCTWTKEQWETLQWATTQKHKKVHRNAKKQKLPWREHCMTQNEKRHESNWHVAELGNEQKTWELSEQLCNWWWKNEGRAKNA